jgi:2-desacetyl-2-hydroxyethyl bacteriochlorophyllide A dehydrogenase
MQALIFKDVRTMALEEVADPSPESGEAIVEVGACGICGSDLEGYVGTPGMRARRVPPLLLGHEFAGTVVSGPSDMAGRRVAVYPLVTCGRCDKCAAGMTQLCRSRSLIGLQRPGAFAQRVAVPVRQLHELPDGVPPHVGAVAEPLAVALHALALAGHSVSERRVMVFGAGAIGWLAGWAAARAGAVVTSIDVDPSRRRRAVEAGVEAAEAPPQEEADVTIDSVGVQATRKAAVESLTPGGVAIFLGLHDDSHEASFYPLVLEERKIQGCFAYDVDDFRRAIELCGEVPASYVARVPLSKGNEAFEALARGDDYLKIVLEPNGDNAA